MKILRYRKVLLASALLLGMAASQRALAEAGFTLGGPVWTNGQVQFTLYCASNGAYVIEHSSDLLNWTA